MAIKRQDPLKRFRSLWKFIEADLTRENWRDLTDRAIRRNLPFPPPYRGPYDDRPRVVRQRGANRYLYVEDEIRTLSDAQVLQASYRRALRLFEGRDYRSCRTTDKALLDARFDALKRRLANPPMVVTPTNDDMLGPGWQRLENWAVTDISRCLVPGCGRYFARNGDRKRTSCGRSKCRAKADNTRRGLSGTKITTTRE